MISLCISSLIFDPFTKMWVFDMAYVDRTNWQDYNIMYDQLTRDADDNSNVREHGPIN